jgi:hypothetical protein
LAAQGGARPAREDGGGGPFQRGLWWSSDGVDALMDAVQPAGLASMGDRVCSQPNREQLPAGDVAVLAVSDLRDLLVD